MNNKQGLLLRSQGYCYTEFGVQYKSILRTGATCVSLCINNFGLPSMHQLPCDLASVHTGISQEDLSLNDSDAYYYRQYASNGWLKFLPVINGPLFHKWNKTSRASNRLLASRFNCDGQPWATSYTIKSQWLSFTTMCMNNVSIYIDLTKGDACPSCLRNNYDQMKEVKSTIFLQWPTFHQICLSHAQPVTAATVLSYRLSFWVRLNNIRSGTARVGETLQLWGMQEAGHHVHVGHPTQTVEHVVTDCQHCSSRPGASLLFAIRSLILWSWNQRTAHWTLMNLCTMNFWLPSCCLTNCLVVCTESEL